ncbi:hypothetical protein [uncultured Amnibacterium sp.]|uniref:hypothetical protein n=1 Tax=uncultured Amnibacterium sp. TaxID=1631851 RepID=UPI0035CB6AD5
MVGAPIGLTVGNLARPTIDGSPAAQAQAIAAHAGQYLFSSVADAAGFALLGALGVGIAMLLPGRGGRFGTIGALLTVIGGVVMGGAVLTSSFVQAAIPASLAPQVQPVIESNAALGGLFDFALVAAVGGLLGAVGLLIGRPVPIWLTVLLIVSILISNFGGGLLGAVLSLPFLVVTALLAGALIRRSPAPEPQPLERTRTAAVA